MRPNRSQIRDPKLRRGKHTSLPDLFLAALLGLLIGVLLLFLLVGRRRDQWRCLAWLCGV